MPSNLINPIDTNDSNFYSICLDELQPNNELESYMAFNTLTWNLDFELGNALEIGLVESRLVKKKQMNTSSIHNESFFEELDTMDNKLYAAFRRYYDGRFDAPSQLNHNSLAEIRRFLSTDISQSLGDELN
jgi:hypothetical protein